MADESLTEAEMLDIVRKLYQESQCCLDADCALENVGSVPDHGGFLQGCAIAALDQGVGQEGEVVQHASGEISIPHSRFGSAALAECRATLCCWFVGDDQSEAQGSWGYGSRFSQAQAGAC